MFKRFFVFLGLLALLIPTVAPGQLQPVPAPKVREYVTDQTGTLSASDISLLNEKLRAFDKQTTTQIVVVMLPTIGENILEEVSLKVAEANGIGRKDNDNGVLLLIVKNDRLMRIEVGYGLEGALTDALSSQIIRKEITPRFREGDFAGGVNAGVDAIMAATKNEYKADPAGDPKKKTFPWQFILMIVIFAIIVSRRRRSGIGRGGGGSPAYRWGIRWQVEVLEGEAGSAVAAVHSAGAGRAAAGRIREDSLSTVPEQSIDSAAFIGGSSRSACPRRRRCRTEDRRLEPGIRTTLPWRLHRTCSHSPDSWVTGTNEPGSNSAPSRLPVRTIPTSPESMKCSCRPHPARTVRSNCLPPRLRWMKSVDCTSSFRTSPPHGEAFVAHRSRNSATAYSSKAVPPLLRSFATGPSSL